mmetsp:Transcript_30629/g.45326  ORF Transcript_30629/g.45326 Transcript_30629/m.45326 type:complete len:262 (+) Transcript_30629:44-829(+)|eukprot:CAMPEP_0195517914 /NCGR_PEP_ID=MMETSP0794_2-20130614/11819_1 /TAXON_ID=515487 /ORGANISM="Stephanopyxis turris, Strain CCMP 815" /LENGTH=261 /DNA_ID=CAMNT_0040646791 /DNA_START=41 /DNA_END=826 /DNA_ORIENTATION=-
MTDDAERLRICRHLLLSAPPGQFHAILSDLHTIVQPSCSILSESWINNVQSEYWSRNCYAVPSIDDNEHEQQHVTLCTALKDNITKHVLGDPNKGIICNCAFVASEESKVEIAISRENIHNLNKFYSGSWNGGYTLSIQSDANTNATLYELKGVAHIHAHAFENGNVQLRCKREFGPISFNHDHDEGIVANKIARQIQEWEMELLDALRDMYRRMGDEMLKSMRRVMPLSRTRMDWNVQPHRTVKSLNTFVKEATKSNSQK